MRFWDLPSDYAQHTAVVGVEGEEHSYAALLKLVIQQEKVLAELGSRTFGFMMCENQLEDLVLYLACIRRGHVPLMLTKQMPQEQLASLKARYKPQWIAMQGVLKVQANAKSIDLNPALGLLLSTSGSTGSPRLVRLAREALQANAKSIVTYLGLNQMERAITSLPMYYSYGLSLINSHLLCGGALVLNRDSVLSRNFLQRLREQKVTSLAGVPYMYQMLNRTAFFNLELPDLRTLTQAGGQLDEKLTRKVAEYARTTERRFFVMYGQTEACARISYVPPAQLIHKIGSIGIPIPGGALEVNANSGELVYRGQNVMLGYADHPDDLSRGDDCQGLLHTGDLGRIDEDGFFYIVGRLKRFIKIAGNRIGLDEVERALQALLQIEIAVSGEDDLLIIWLESQDHMQAETVQNFLRQQYAIHPTMVRLHMVEKIPLLPTGKKNYGALLSL